MIELIVTISLISIVAIFSFGRFVNVESFRDNTSANETLNNLKFIQQLAYQQRRNIYFNQYNNMLLFCYDNIASLCPPNKTVLRDSKAITARLPISNLSNIFFLQMVDLMALLWSLILINFRWSFIMVLDL